MKAKIQTGLAFSAGLLPLAVVPLYLIIAFDYPGWVFTVAHSAAVWTVFLAPLSALLLISALACFGKLTLARGLYMAFGALTAVCELAYLYFMLPLLT